MKTLLYIMLVGELLSVPLFLYFNKTPQKIDIEARKQAIAYKKKFAAGCGPALSGIDFSDPTTDIPLLDGWGNYRMPVTESNDSAKIYFEQGINFYYGFHIIESLASFEKSTRFDNKFAMGYWGIALAYGPNINDLGYAASPESLEAVDKAKQLYGNCTALEKALIDAMQTRYSADTTLSRETLNQRYADAMRNVHTTFPGSEDAAALCADALMVQHPWDFYDHEGKAKSWTPEIVALLESILQKDPNHPGAAHYYIHAIEASDHPERGLAVAKRLPSLMPGVSHLVHMPSHIYIRSGYYQDGVLVNDSAVKQYYSYLAKFPVTENASFLYLVHNLHMEASCANMDGRYADAMKISADCRQSFDSSVLSSGGYMGMYSQYVYMTPLLTQIRFGKWDEILKTVPVPDAYSYANILWHYGRGLAYARQHEFDEASKELVAMRLHFNDQVMLDHPPAFNPGIAGAKVAEKILEGTMALEKEDYDNAIVFFNEAVQREDNMLYNEPKDWVHPARQYLADALMKMGKYGQASTVLQEDLKINANNGWSLTALSTCYLVQNKKKESLATQQLAKKAFERADTRITAAVF